MELSKRNGLLIIAPRGPLTGGKEIDVLDDLLRRLNRENYDAHVIIDCSHITMMNSAALGVLITAHVGFTRRGRQLVLANVTKRIVQIFRLTKLSQVFATHPTVADAINALRATVPS
jgi:anti-sigma B factor antagonist